LTKIHAKNEFYIFVPSDLDPRLPLDLKFAPLVTLVQSCVSIKLAISTAFPFLENSRHVTDGQTDGRGAILNAAPRDCRIIIFSLLYAQGNITAF